MTQNIARDYYEPLRKKAKNCRAIIVFDSSALISFANIPTRNFSTGKPRANKLTPLLELVPIYARHGFIPTVSEIVSWETGRVLRDGSYGKRFFTQSRNRDTDSHIFRTIFYPEGRRREWINILPTIRPQTDQEIAIEAVVSEIARFEGLPQKYANLKQLASAREAVAGEIRNIIMSYKSCEDAGEKSTRGMIIDLFPLDCPVFYISQDGDSLKMMQKIGCISLHTLRYLEVIRAKSLLSIIDIDDKDDSFIPYMTPFICPSSDYDPQKRLEGFQEDYKNLVEFSDCLDGIAEHEAALAHIAPNGSFARNRSHSGSAPLRAGVGS